MFCRSRALEHLVHRAGTDAATTTTYARRPVHRTLRRGSEVIATDAIERTAASVGDSSLRSPCCVVMRRRRTVLWLVATRALFVASRSSSCATYASTWRNTGRSVSSARSVDSDLAGPAPWCDTAGSASIQRTYRNELSLMQCEHDTTRKIVSTKLCRQCVSLRASIRSSCVNSRDEQHNYHTTCSGFVDAIMYSNYTRH